MKQQVHQNSDSKAEAAKLAKSMVTALEKQLRGNSQGSKLK